MPRSPRSGVLAGAFTPKNLDLSQLEEKLALAFKPKTWSRSSSKSSGSPASPSLDENPESNTHVVEDFEPFNADININAIRNDFDHLCLDCIRRLTSSQFFHVFSFEQRSSYFRYTQSITGLEQAANACDLCAEVFRHWSFCWGYQDEGQWETVCVFLEPEINRDYHYTQGISIHVKPLQLAQGEFLYMDDQEGQFWVYTTEDDPAAGQIKPREVNHRVNSPEALAKAKQWLKQCINEHPSCHKPDPKSLPTRLLDVSSSKPQLIQTNKATSVHYAALSYCWGGDSFQPNQLTTTNIETYNSGIPLEALPKTLQDAIAVTRALGLSYVWIDSTCIMQNDEEDKRTEIAKIRHIYANSYITIVASTAETADSGFLQDRDAPPPPNLRLPFPCANGVVGTIYLRGKRSAGWVQYDAERFFTERRAWTMEEKLLSPRVLMYTNKQLRWVCNTVVDCDGGHVDSRTKKVVAFPGQALYVPIGASPDRLQEYLVMKGVADEVDKKARFRDAWSITVSCYTRRLVTNAKDRLRAIGGIAEQFANLSGYGYVAGLWRETLVYELLWMEEDPNRITHPGWEEYTGGDPASFWRHIKHPVAPSWSWAGAHYPITPWMHGEIQFEDFHVKACDVVLQSEKRPFGEVLSGRLTIRARCMVVYLFESKIQIRMALPRPDKHGRNWEYRTVGSAVLDPSRSAWRKDDVPFIDEGRIKVALLNFGTFGDAGERTGLVLVRAYDNPDAKAKNLFNRIGVFTMDVSHQFVPRIGPSFDLTPKFDPKDLEEVIIV